MKTLIFILFLFLTAAGFSQPPVAKENFYIFLLAGQSNMAGRGLVEEMDTVTHSRIWMLDKNNQWQPAKEPLHFDKPVAGVGPGLSFARKMAEMHPGVHIGLVPAAVGGSSIQYWQPSQYYQPTASYPYDDAIRRAKLAMHTGVLKAILWHQGESDANAAQAAVYEKKLIGLVKRYRKDLRIKKLPFIGGTLANFYVATHPFASKINAAILALPTHEKKTAVVNTSDLKAGSDGIHFSNTAARALGERYAEAYIQLTTKQ